MGFANHKTLSDAYSLGYTQYSTWRKTPSQTTAQGVWIDMSMSPGNPAPQYYASEPLVANDMSGSLGGGVYHHGAVSPKTKHLASLTAYTVTAAAVPIVLYLCDYLLYYPFIDMGTTDTQLLDNTQTLTRYTDEKNLQVMAVQVASQAFGGVRFFFTYTNSDDVPDRNSQVVRCNTSTATGTLITTERATLGCAGPFIPLQEGDKGVKSIQSVTFLGTDVGLITLVLVKPIASMMIRGIDAPVEVNFLKDRPSLPRIYDGAYLNFIAMPNGNISAAPIFGDATFIWS